MWPVFVRDIMRFIYINRKDFIAWTTLWLNVLVACLNGAYYYRKVCENYCAPHLFNFYVPDALRVSLSILFDGLTQCSCLRLR